MKELKSAVKARNKLSWLPQDCAGGKRLGGPFTTITFKYSCKAYGGGGGGHSRRTNCFNVGRMRNMTPVASRSAAR